MAFREVSVTQVKEVLRRWLRDDEVGPEQLVDHLAHGVVGESPVEGVHELGAVK